MKFVFWLLLLTACGLSAQDDWMRKNRENEIQQVDLWRENLKKSSTIEGSEKVNFLSIGLRNMAHRRTLSDHGPEVDELYFRIQSEMLAILGHSENYRDRILSAREEYEKLKGQGNIGLEDNARTELSNMQTEGFRTMAYLPSVETVRVLGEFLADERGYTKLPPNPTVDEMEKAGMEIPNCKAAAKALVCLPLVSKPQNKNWMMMTFEDVAPWREWYEQIKAGNRTFRFEGDPIEYDLSGPAPKEKLERIARADKRDAERAGGTRKGQEQPVVKGERTQGRSGLIIWISSVFLLVLAFLCGWSKRKKVA